MFKMMLGYVNCILPAVLTLLVIRLSTAEFLHDTSMISIHPRAPENHSQFGFAMGYLSKTNHLVVGAPNASLSGKVYICNMFNANILKEIDCEEKPYKITSSTKLENQHLYLGSSIAASSEHFLTCAPLWTADLKLRGFRGPDVIGKCFFDENDRKHFGTYDKYQYDRRKGFSRVKPEQFIGGTGWSTLADESNNLYLVVKTSLAGDITYGSIKTDTKETFFKTDSMVLKKGTFLDTTKYFNIGFGVTSGKFFSAKTVYAFNMELKNMYGIIEFLEYDSLKKKLYLMNTQTNKQIFTIMSEAVGTKFGSVLAAIDLDKDGLDELLVGEPLYSIEDCVECGALHIYLGGEMNSIGTRNYLQITGLDDFGRLGSAIAVNDLDGDGIAEIAVSAPYANKGLGVVYIISGYEVNQKIQQKKHIQVQLSDFKHKQRILKNTSHKFGFSLQFISDIDENGCSELVAGAPGSAEALLFRCIQAIDIELFNKLLGEQIVREQDLNFTIQVCAEVEYPVKPHYTYAKIRMKSEIIGVRAYIPTPEVDIDISCNNCSEKATFCENITVFLSSKEPGYYKFHSEVKVITDHIFNSTVFNSSWVIATPHSRLHTGRNVSRYCRGEDCNPNLSMELSWSRSKDEPFILGSSETETINILLHNDGHDAYEACVWISLEGAQLQQLSRHDECRASDGGYRCDLPKPFKRDHKRDITLVLNMPSTNEYKQLDFRAYLYETCSNELIVKDAQFMNISYITDASEISIYGTNHERQLSYKENNENKTSIIDVQEFSINNTGRITWKNVYVIVSTNSTNYTKMFKVTAGPEKKTCGEVQKGLEFIHKCFLDIIPNGTLNIVATVYISKSNLKNYLINNKLIVTYDLQLHLNTTEVKTMGVLSELKFEMELPFGQNKLLIGIVAAVIATLLLILVFIVLYKNGFFAREQKRKLLVHKESIRQRSFRRDTHIASVADEPYPEGIPDVEDDKDDDAFEKVIPPTKLNSDTIQVEARALVHC